MKFINIIGTTGSGKSTFARQLAQKLDLAYIEMDDLFWLDNWQEPTDEVFFEKLKNKIQCRALSPIAADINSTKIPPTSQLRFW